MPRKTKEQNEKELKSQTATSAAKSTKKVATAKAATKTTNKDVAKKAPKTTTAAKNSTSKSVANKTTTKSATAKKASTKTTASKSAVKKATAKNKDLATKKAVTKTTAKKATKKSKSTTKTITKKGAKPLETVEYYDLPYRYNQTVVRLLAQTPTTLFIYWDISDKDRKAFEEQYGENFFQETKPVLIVHNDTLNYSFEVEINDFANSWYLHVADSKCDYRIELGRRPIVNKDKLEHTDYIYVTTSNELEAPNDRILLNKEQKMVYFRNVKTGATQEKQFASLSFMRNMGKIYNIYDLYKTIYKNENVEDIYDLTNPSSHPSS